MPLLLPHLKRLLVPLLLLVVGEVAGGAVGAVGGLAGLKARAVVAPTPRLLQTTSLASLLQLSPHHELPPECKKRVH